MRYQLLGRANGLYGGVFSGESFTVSQGFHFGSVNNNPAHRVEIVEGDYIDLRPDLDATAIGKRKADGANGKERPDGTETAWPRVDACSQAKSRTRTFGTFGGVKVPVPLLA
jgi:hypothetical protein